MVFLFDYFLNLFLNNTERLRVKSQIYSLCDIMMHGPEGRGYDWYSCPKVGIGDRVKPCKSFFILYLIPSNVNRTIVFFGNKNSSQALCSLHFLLVLLDLFL